MEINSTTRSIIIAAGDDSQTGHARRQSMALAGTMDFTELRCGQLGIVVTELARNLSLHGGGGEILLTPWQNGQDAGLDVLALDFGAGIANISAAMEDGYSTGGTAGTGLGAVERLAAIFQIYSKQGKGAAMFARVLRSDGASTSAASPWRGSVNLPLDGETVCGDVWRAYSEPGRTLYIVADGLGHGPIAHEAAAEATAAFLRYTAYSPKQILQEIHLALAKTRGAAVAVAEILHDRGVLNYSGSGNIAGVVYGDEAARSLITMSGTPGHNINTLQEFAYPWKAGFTLLMHSDGLGTRWNLNDYPGLLSRHPSLVAGVLFRDFTRRRDDATILVTGN